MKVMGFDFTSAPRPKKPITCAHGLLAENLLQILGIQRIANFPQFEVALTAPGPWIAGFDFPFGLPRIFVQRSDWPIGQVT